MDALAHVKVSGRIVEIVESLGRIDLDNLAGEVAEVGAQAIWWGVLAAQARTETNRTALDLDVVKAEVSKEVRIRLAQSREKVTEGMVDEHVTADERVKEAERARIEAEEKFGMVQSVKAAIEQKARNLERAISGQLGQELSARRAPLLPKESREVHRTPVR